jgi:FAD-linked sulfhydryl oxidase
MNAATGNALWRLLHAYALGYPKQADDAAKQGAALFLETWSGLVEENSTGCGSCHRKWKLLVQRHPPDLSGREIFYQWTSAAHDWINRELGKPWPFNATNLQHAIFGVNLRNG